MEETIGDQAERVKYFSQQHVEEEGYAVAPSVWLRVDRDLSVTFTSELVAEHGDSAANRRNVAWSGEGVNVGADPWARPHGGAGVARGVSAHLPGEQFAMGATAIKMKGNRRWRWYRNMSKKSLPGTNLIVRLNSLLARIGRRDLGEKGTIFRLPPAR